MSNKATSKTTRRFKILESGIFYPHYCMKCRCMYYGDKYQIKRKCPVCSELDKVIAAFGD